MEVGLTGLGIRRRLESVLMRDGDMELLRMRTSAVRPQAVVV